MLSLILNAQAIEQDKGKHLVASSIISTALYTACLNSGCEKPKSKAFALTMFVGAMKEMHDDKIDSRDLLYDAIGALLPLSLTWEF